METFSALLAFCAGNSPVTGEFPSQRPVTRGFNVSLIFAWINGWVNNREAGGLRRHRAHYDDIVMYQRYAGNTFRSITSWISSGFVFLSGNWTPIQETFASLSETIIPGWFNFACWNLCYCICHAVFLKIVFFITMFHCNDVMMNAMASPILGVSIVCSAVCSGAD